MTSALSSMDLLE
jgi:hypothetical protein